MQDRIAASGLLNGRSATTHWRYTELLARKFPSVTVNPDVLFVEDKGIYTSAGSAAGLDLGLHIIRQDFGARVASSVARRLVLPAQRDGGQRQFVPRPEPKMRGCSSLSTLKDEIRSSLNEKWPIARMARVAGISPRSLTRRFHTEDAAAPMQWLTSERVYRAAELLENNKIPLPDIADACGFGSVETFRREFRRRMGVPPGKYRDRMGCPSGCAVEPLNGTHVAQS